MLPKKTMLVPVNEPNLVGNEKKYLNECLDTGWISSDGPFIKLFEHAFAQRVQRKHGIAVSNGSVALDLAIQALNIGKGDEVIMPTFTIISCAAAIIRAGAIPVLVDSDPATWNMRVDQIEAKITSRTKAIMVVHLYGLPVDMDPVLFLAYKYGLKIIEDAAQAAGLLYKGRPCGSFGDISTFSFYANKQVTTGEGGMVLVNDDALAERCRSLRNLCFKPERRFVHDELGYNFRMTNMQAALGLAQVEKLDQTIAKKKSIGAFYTRYLRSLIHLQIPLERIDGAENEYWIYGLVVKPSSPYSADELVQKLAQRGVATRPFFWPMHEQPVFQRMGLFVDECYLIAESIARHGFYIPSGIALTQEKQVYVIEVLYECF